MSSRSLRPRAASSRARTPRYQAPPGVQPAPATRYAPSKTKPVGDRLDRGPRGPSARRARCATCRAARARDGPAGRRGAGGARLRRRHARASSRAHARGRCRRSASASAARRRRARTRPGARTRAGRRSRRPTRGSRGGTARRPTIRTGSSAARPSIRARRPSGRDRQEPVVAARPQPGDGAHRVAAEAVADEPFAARRLLEVPHACGPRAIIRAARRHASEQLAERRDLRAAAAADHVRHDPRPPGLVRGAEPGAVVAVEVLVEEDVVLPVRVVLERVDPAVAGTSPVLADQEERDQPRRMSSPISASVCCRRIRSGTRASASSPK